MDATYPLAVVLGSAGGALFALSTNPLMMGAGAGLILVGLVIALYQPKPRETAVDRILRERVLRERVQARARD